MNAQIFVEGGGDSAQLRSRCREAFSKLLRNCGFDGSMPRIYAVGRRRSAFDRFKTAHGGACDTEYVAMLIDSETRVTDENRTWDHLASRPGDRWQRPSGATDEQVLFMTTSMETWIAVDHDALRGRFPRSFDERRLPSLSGIESKTPDEVYEALRRATGNGYSKGRVSFELLGELDPNVLQQHLPSFRRARRILNEKLGS